MFCWLLYITVMSETELGKLTVVSPSVPPLTSISSASVNRVSNSLTSSVSLTQCTPQEKNNITENRLQMMERNISSLKETLNRFIEAQRTSREQVRNEGRYSTRRSPIREKYKGSHRSRSPHRRHHIHHIHRQCSESPISLAASQSDITTNTGPAISGQLAEVAKRYWEEESRKSLVVSKIAERLLIPNNCWFVRVPKLNEAVA